MQEAQRHGSSAQSELDRSQMNLRRLEEEVSVHCLRRHTLILVVSPTNDECFLLSPACRVHVTVLKPVFGCLFKITCKKKENERDKNAQHHHAS